MYKPEAITVTAEVHEESPESAAELVPDPKPQHGSFPRTHDFLNRMLDNVESAPPGELGSLDGTSHKTALVPSKL